MSQTVTLSGGRTVRTYSEEELKDVREHQKKSVEREKKKSRRNQYPRRSRGGTLSCYGGNQMQKEQIKKIEEVHTKLKKGHEPWPEQELKVMQLGIDQLIQKRDSMRQELVTEKTGLDEMDKEIQINIDQAALQVKAAKMALGSLLFDQKFDLTINKHKNRVGELEQEIERHNHNVEVFQKQLDEGRPKRKEPKPAKEAQREMSQEEFDELKKSKEVDKDARQSKEEKVRQAKSKPDPKARS